MDGVHISTTTDFGIWSAATDLTLELIGQNTVTSSLAVAAIAANVDLEITGSGALAATGSVNAGIDVLRKLTIGGSSIVTATGTTGMGIRAWTFMVVIAENSTVIASGRNSGLYSESGGIQITGGTVIATSTNEYGIEARGGSGLTISGGTVTARTANPAKEGIYVQVVGQFLINGGTVKAEGMNPSTASAFATIPAAASMYQQPRGTTPVYTAATPLHQLVIPTTGKVQSVTVDLSSVASAASPTVRNFNISANHPNGDNNLYLWVPLGVTAANVTVICAPILPVPKTGDDFPLMELAALTVLAAAGGMVLLVRGGKKESKQQG